MRGLDGVRRWQIRHPLLVDALLAVLVFAAAVWGPLAGDDAHDPDHDHDIDGPRPRGVVLHGHPPLDIAIIVLIGLAAASLVLRRRFPVPVWAATLAVAVVIVLDKGNLTAAVAPAFLALYTVGSRTPFAVTAGATLLTGTVYGTAVALSDVVPSEHALSLLGFTFAAAALGVAVRSQRAAVEAAEARARQAEHTREEEAERRVTDERLRIARELHDVVAHHISVINVQAGVARHLMDRQPEAARTALGLVREASRTVLAEMSTVLGLLRTQDDSPTDGAPTQPAPGLDQVPALVETMRTAGLQTTWRVTGDPAPLDPLPDLTAYRVVQESLTNALRHGTGSAELVVAHDREHVVVEVTNPVAAERHPGGGHGLVGMTERIASVGGRLTVGPADGGRFAVRAEIPRRATR